MKLKDKVAVVTGGASGLGQATVERFVAEGAKVVIFDLNEEAAQALCRELGDNTAYAVVNVTDEASVEAGIQKTLAAFGAIHILVNCAGVGTPAKTLGKEGPIPLQQFTKIIDINLNGTFNVLRLAAAEMAKNEPVNESGERGVIINTASVAAFDGQIGQAAYSASKAGVCGMTLPIARELAAYGIRINTIAPGLFLTPLAKSLSQKVLDALAANVQFPKRFGEPSEYADFVTHMVENSYLNGEVIRLDGAIRMQPR
ncbi:MAG: 3-hydroxyacyl-CoA dehydrogenase [Clostridia bacterium]|nr:3-hydroxyacyl-CoA dehydrogenase [Clostridia bacterium]